MEARVPHVDTAPGWRELIEALNDAPDAAREREALLTRLLDEERRELKRLRASRPRMAAAVATPRGPSELHRKMLAAIGQAPAGLMCAQVEVAVGTKPLSNVLDGLVRRGPVRRLGKGVFALGDDASRT